MTSTAKFGAFSGLRAFSDRVSGGFCQTALSIFPRVHITPVPSTANHRQDAGLGSRRQRRPSIDHSRQIGVQRSFPCSKCAAFCAAWVIDPLIFP